MNKSMRVLITEKCNANCKNCFNKSTRINKDMDVDEFKGLCKYLSSECGIESIKIMGGEPTVHHDFEKIIQIAQENFKTIAIFTNAINDRIKNINPRECDKIIYNLECIELDTDINKFLITGKGFRVLETQISHDSDIELIKKKILYIREAMREKKPFYVSLTLNCMENIFMYKDILKVKWNNILKFLQENNIQKFVDHNIPLCFQKLGGIRSYATSLCSPKCAGLITSDLNLRYCNQNPVNLGKIYNSETKKYMPHSEMVIHLERAYNDKLKINNDKICNQCQFWGKNCNGGCFIHKAFITKDSIIKNLI